MRRLTFGLMALAVVASGCGGSGTSDTPAPATPVATALQVSPTRLELGEHLTRQLTATVLDQTGAKMDVPVLWQSSDQAVASVSDSGAVTAISEGSAIIWARASYQLETVPVTVVPGLVVDIFQSDSIAVDSTATDSTAIQPSNCFYTLTAVASGGAPGDSATWIQSQIEFLDTSGTEMIDTLSVENMLDRFGSQVIRSGDTLTTRPLLATTPVPGTRIVNRVRYAVGNELHSKGITINCSANAGSGPPG